MKLEAYNYILGEWHVVTFWRFLKVLIVGNCKVRITVVRGFKLA